MCITSLERTVIDHLSKPVDEPKENVSGVTVKTDILRGWTHQYQFMMLVETVSALEACCGDATQAGGFVGLDTEFLRERTYRADLCLVQLATSDADIYCIDPLAVDNLDPLRQLCEQDDLLKIFHAARQDLEVLYQNLGVVPRPVFDTQVAAAFCGYGEQIGYAGLVQKVTGIELSKTQTRTDWQKRPLRDAQLTYAEEDVQHLAVCHAHLRDELDRLGRTEWLLEDLQQLVTEDLYAMSPYSAWQRVKGMANLHDVERGRLVTLAAWREDHAATANLPREWVIKDRALIDLVRSGGDEHVDDDQLINAGLTDKQTQQWGDAIRAALQAPPADVQGHGVPRLTSSDEKRRKVLMSTLKAEAEALGVSPSLLGSRRDVEALIVAPEQSMLSGGWRRDVIGDTLLAELSRL